MANNYSKIIYESKPIGKEKIKLFLTTLSLNKIKTEKSKKLKIRIKGWLLVKIAKYRKEIKAYKERIAEDVIEKQQLIDKTNLLQSDIRELLLKLSKEERELWLNKKGKNYERHTPKKK